MRRNDKSGQYWGLVPFTRTPVGKHIAEPLAWLFVSWGVKDTRQVLKADTTNPFPHCLPAEPMKTVLDHARDKFTHWPRIKPSVIAMMKTPVHLRTSFNEFAFVVSSLRVACRAWAPIRARYVCKSTPILKSPKNNKALISTQWWITRPTQRKSLLRQYATFSQIRTLCRPVNISCQARLEIYSFLKTVDWGHLIWKRE